MAEPSPKVWSVSAQSHSPHVHLADTPQSTAPLLPGAASTKQQPTGLCPCFPHPCTCTARSLLPTLPLGSRQPWLFRKKQSNCRVSNPTGEQLASQKTQNHPKNLTTVSGKKTNKQHRLHECRCLTPCFHACFARRHRVQNSCRFPHCLTGTLLKGNGALLEGRWGAGGGAEHVGSRGSGCFLPANGTCGRLHPRSAPLGHADGPKGCAVLAGRGARAASTLQQVKVTT